MTFTPHGLHLIAGEWVSGTDQFWSEPATGPKHAFSVGTVDLVAHACDAAEAAFWSYSATSREQRARFLEAIADEIDALGDDFVAIVCRETALPAARIQGERGRTSGQMRLFASVLRRGDFYGARIDQALPDRQPLPRADLRQWRIGVGPVAVFGASNFPLAFSTAGVAWYFQGQALVQVPWLASRLFI